MILREGIEYKELPKEEKSYAIHNMFAYVREHPILIKESISMLERWKVYLRLKVRGASGREAAKCYLNGGLFF